MSETRQPGRARLGGLQLCLRFIPLAVICLFLWLLALPGYTWFVGQVTMLILKYILRYPIDGVIVAKAGLLNTGTSLGYVMGEHTLTMQDVGHLVTNVAPYAALVLATPKLRWLRRLRILGLGILIIFAFHVATIMLRFVAGRTSLPTAIGFIAITLPFLLWIVLAYWDKLLAYLGNDEPAGG
jgi:hypothetical protein